MNDDLQEIFDFYSNLESYLKITSVMSEERQETYSKLLDNILILRKL